MTHEYIHKVFPDKKYISIQISCYFSSCSLNLYQTSLALHAQEISEIQLVPNTAFSLQLPASHYMVTLSHKPISKHANWYKFTQ